MIIVDSKLIMPEMLTMKAALCLAVGGHLNVDSATSQTRS